MGAGASYAEGADFSDCPTTLHQAIIALGDVRVMLTDNDKDKDRESNDKMVSLPSFLALDDEGQLDALTKHESEESIEIVTIDLNSNTDELRQNWTNISESGQNNVYSIVANKEEDFVHDRNSSAAWPERVVALDLSVNTSSSQIVFGASNVVKLIDLSSCER